LPSLWLPPHGSLLRRVPANTLTLPKGSVDSAGLRCGQGSRRPASYLPARSLVGPHQIQRRREAGGPTRCTDALRCVVYAIDRVPACRYLATLIGKSPSSCACQPCSEVMAARSSSSRSFATFASFAARARCFFPAVTFF